MLAFLVQERLHPSECRLVGLQTPSERRRRTWGYRRAVRYKCLGPGGEGPPPWVHIVPCSQRTQPSQTDAADSCEMEHGLRHGREFSLVLLTMSSALNGAIANPPTSVMRSGSRCPDTYRAGGTGEKLAEPIREACSGHQARARVSARICFGILVTLCV